MADCCTVDLPAVSGSLARRHSVPDKRYPSLACLQDAALTRSLRQYRDGLPRCILFLLSLAAATPAVSTLPVEAERLEYTVGYRGLFSAFLPVDIARVVLRLHTTCHLPAVVPSQPTAEYNESGGIKPPSLGHLDGHDLSASHRLRQHPQVHAGAARYLRSGG